MKSMTGFGSGKVENDKYKVETEIRSVNNRYLDISIRMPKELSTLENTVRERVKKYVIRGKVSVNISPEPVGLDEQTMINSTLVRQKYQALQKVKDLLHLHEEISLHHLLAFPEIFVPSSRAVDLQSISRLIDQSVDLALSQFDQMRQNEGENLKQDMIERAETIHNLNNKVRELAGNQPKSEFERLQKQVGQLLEDQNIDPARLDQELAIIADRMDITEECVRMDSHVRLLKQTMNNEKEIGKRINFILQEMNREATTMNSKSTSIEISHMVIHMKEEIEKLREQTQNIE